MQFSQIPGLQDVKQHLLNAVNQNHLAHALLIYGAEGSAALAMSLAMAAYVNCENKVDEKDSCGTCPSCLKINKMTHPDLNFVLPYANIAEKLKEAKKESDESGKVVLSSDLFLPNWRTFIEKSAYGNLSDWSNHIEADGKQMLIPVTEGRHIIRKLSLKAYEAEYKVMLIWLPETMNVECANSILKALEEPQRKTLFLLVSQQPDLMLSTILSRTQMVRVRPFNDEEISAYLVQQLNVGVEEAKEISFLADGSLRKAIHLTEESSSEIGPLFIEWLRICFMKTKLMEGLEWAEKFSGLNKDEQVNFFQMGLNYFREGLLMVNDSEDILRLQNEDKDFIKKLSKFLSNDKIEEAAILFSEAIYHIERNANSKILITDLYFKINSIFNKA